MIVPDMELAGVAEEAWSLLELQAEEASKLQAEEAWSLLEL